MPKSDKPRREFDSSVTRVAPVFSKLEHRTDAWLAKLLDLAASGIGRSDRPWANDDLAPQRVDFAHESSEMGHVKKKERALDPPRSLLVWLVENVQNPDARQLSVSPEVAKRRQKILERDPSTTAEALQALKRNDRAGAWSRFEGPTYPDVVIETNDALVVIEGKRTEPKATTRTTWMPIRHQMLRHLDAAWEIRGNRDVFGMFIVEAEPEVDVAAVPEKWIAAARQTTSPTALDESLPHRSAAERADIAAAFVGVSTWQIVCAEFGIQIDLS